jgi:hypothetical protein
MMYFLDFDRTTFDTDSFVTYLSTHPFAKNFKGLPELELARKLNEAVEAGELSFSPGELTPFLYEDAGQFLREKENGVMLITYGNPAFQRAKVESAIYGIPRISTIYTGEVRKGEYMAPHIGMYGATPTFVDDSVVELEILTQKCPGARVIEIRRDGKGGVGHWPVLQSLSDRSL